MKILLAPGPLWPEPGGAPLAGSSHGLSAPQVAQALAQGWRAARPEDELTLLPLADGGPLSAQALPEHLVAERRTLRAPDPLGALQEVDLVRLTAPAPGGGCDPASPTAQAPARTWYLDAARLLALPPDPAEAGRHTRQGSTRGLSDLLIQAIELIGPGATLLVGLARTAVHDAGAGLLEELGGLEGARQRLGANGVVLLLADDLPLGGLDGAGSSLTRVTDLDAYEAQETDVKAGAAAGALLRQESQGSARRLPVLGQRQDRLSATSWGTGAAGGAALALRLAGASAVHGSRALAALVGLEPAAREQDLCLTATGSLYSLGTASLPALVGEQALANAVPAVLVSGRCRCPRPELAEAGVVSTYELEAPARTGGQDLSWEEMGPVVLTNRLHALGERLALSWSR